VQEGDVFVAICAILHAMHREIARILFDIIHKTAFLVKKIALSFHPQSVALIEGQNEN